MASITRTHNARLRLELREKERQEDEISKMNVWFAKHDSNKSGTLDIVQMTALLTEEIGGEPDAKTVHHVMKSAKIKAARHGHEVLDDIGEVPLAEAKYAVAHYKEYLKKKQIYDELFRKHDRSETGRLERDELTSLMKELAPGTKVREDDVDYVLASCDMDETGTINREELMAVVAVWRKIVVKRRAAPLDCSIL